MIQQTRNIVDEDWVELLRDLLLVCQRQCSLIGNPTWRHVSLGLSTSLSHVGRKRYLLSLAMSTKKDACVAPSKSQKEEHS